jgi:hypothetical protein
MMCNQIKNLLQSWSTVHLEGRSIESSNNPKLGFDNHFYSGLNEITKINQEFANRGATTNIPAYKDINKAVLPELDFNHQAGRGSGYLNFSLVELRTCTKIQRRTQF